MLGIRDSNQKIVTNGLVLHLDAAQKRSYGGSGTTWTDLSGNGRNSTLVNSPTFNNGNGGYFEFSGTHYGTFGASFLPSNYTKECWFYTNSSPTYANLISGDNSNNHAFWLVNGTLHAGQGGDFSRVIGPSIPNNLWRYAAVTFSTTSGWVLYVNGVSQATNANTAVQSGNAVFIAAYNDGSFNRLLGRMAVARIYNRALSASEILQNYNAQKSRFGL